MFTLKRNQNITEQVQIADEVITLDLSADGIYKTVNKAQNELIIVQAKLRNEKATEEDYYMSIDGLYNAVFGSENYDKIKTFYEGNYLEMVTQTTDLLEYVVKKMQESAEKLQKTAGEKYKNAKSIFK